MQKMDFTKTLSTAFPLLSPLEEAKRRQQANWRNLLVRPYPNHISKPTWRSLENEKVVIPMHALPMPSATQLMDPAATKKSRSASESRLKKQRNSASIPATERRFPLPSLSVPKSLKPLFDWTMTSLSSYANPVRDRKEARTSALLSETKPSKSKGKPSAQSPLPRQLADSPLKALSEAKPKVSISDPRALPRKLIDSPLKALSEAKPKNESTITTLPSKVRALADSPLKAMLEQKKASARLYANSTSGVQGASALAVSVANQKGNAIAAGLGETVKAYTLLRAQLARRGQSMLASVSSKAQSIFNFVSQQTPSEASQRSFSISKSKPASGQARQTSQGLTKLSNLSQVKQAPSREGPTSITEGGLSGPLSEPSNRVPARQPLKSASMIESRTLVEDQAFYSIALSPGLHEGIDPLYSGLAQSASAAERAWDDLKKTLQPLASDESKQLLALSLREIKQSPNLKNLWIRGVSEGLIAKAIANAEELIWPLIHSVQLDPEIVQQVQTYWIASLKQSAQTSANYAYQLLSQTPALDPSARSTLSEQNRAPFNASANTLPAKPMPQAVPLSAEAAKALEQFVRKTGLTIRFDGQWRRSVSQKELEGLPGLTKEIGHKAEFQPASLLLQAVPSIKEGAALHLASTPEFKRNARLSDALAKISQSSKLSLSKRLIACLTPRAKVAASSLLASSNEPKSANKMTDRAELTNPETLYPLFDPKASDLRLSDRDLQPVKELVITSLFSAIRQRNLSQVPADPRFKKAQRGTYFVNLFTPTAQGIQAESASRPTTPVELDAYALKQLTAPAKTSLLSQELAAGYYPKGIPTEPAKVTFYHEKQAGPFCQTCCLNNYFGVSWITPELVEQFTERFFPREKSLCPVANGTNKAYLLNALKGIFAAQASKNHFPKTLQSELESYFNLVQSSVNFSDYKHLGAPSAVKAATEAARKTAQRLNASHADRIMIDFLLPETPVNGHAITLRREKGQAEWTLLDSNLAPVSLKLEEFLTALAANSQNFTLYFPESVLSMDQRAQTRNRSVKGTDYLGHPQNFLNQIEQATLEALNINEAMLCPEAEQGRPSLQALYKQAASTLSWGPEQEARLNQLALSDTTLNAWDEFTSQLALRKIYLNYLQETPYFPPDLCSAIRSAKMPLSSELKGALLEWSNQNGALLRSDLTQVKAYIDQSVPLAPKETKILKQFCTRLEAAFASSDEGTFNAKLSEFVPSQEETEAFESFEAKTGFALKGPIRKSIGSVNRTMQDLGWVWRLSLQKTTSIKTVDLSA